MSGRRSVGTSYCAELVADFEQLAIDLALPRAYEKHGRAMTNTMFRYLQQNAWKYDIQIDRVILGGSNGKGTGISYTDSDGRRNSDFDLVLLVNNEEPPFEDVLRAFQALLKEMKLFDSIKKTKISVQCIYKSPVGPIKFDVLPAENHVRRTKDNQNVGHKQARLALQNLKRIFKYGFVDPDEIRLHSASFCEKTVDVIAGYCENEFHLNVVRLAKYWNSQIEFDVYVSGRSAIVELMAINCQIGRRNRCLISGFRRFLEAMADLGNHYANLGSEPQNDPCFQQVISADGPIIIDPANKYNNMAYGMDPDVIATFEREAQETLDRLNDLRDLDGYESVRNLIGRIFSQKY